MVHYKKMDLMVCFRSFAGQIIIIINFLILKSLGEERLT